MNPTFKKIFIGEFSWKRVIRSLFLIPIVVYMGLFAIAWLFPNKLLFRPQHASYTDDSSIIKLTTSDGETISAKFYENEAAHFTILFSHGNAEDIGDNEIFISHLRDSGFAVLVYDYHGYGTSQGSPSEENTYGDIQAAYEYLVGIRKIPAERIILQGRSLGGGAAVDLAVRENVAGLIMESSFTSASRVLTRVAIFPFDKFENIKKISRVNCPVLVIHGKRDWTIPFHHGEDLFAAAKEPKIFLWVDDAGHNNLFSRASGVYLNAIQDFANTLSQ
jgi:abhydrolase domain-containing protein 17